MSTPEGGHSDSGIEMAENDGAGSTERPKTIDMEAERDAPVQQQPVEPTTDSGEEPDAVAGASDSTPNGVDQWDYGRSYDERPYPTNMPEGPYERRFYPNNMPERPYGESHPALMPPSQREPRRGSTASNLDYSETEDEESIPLAPKPTLRGTWVTLEEAWPKIKDALDLEGHLGDVFKKLERGSQEPKKKERSPPVYGIEHMTLAEWGVLPTDTKSQENEVEAERPEYVFEVLTEEPIKIRRGPLAWREPDAETLEAADAKRASIAARSVSGAVPKSWSKSPSQIRITSRELILNFKDIVQKFNWDGPLKASKLMLIRPYKMLFLYEKEIRERHQELEKKYADKSGDTPEAGASGSTPSLPNDSTASLGEVQDQAKANGENNQDQSTEQPSQPAPDSTTGPPADGQPVERTDSKQTEDLNGKVSEPALGRATPGRGTPRRKKKARVQSPPPEEKKPSKDDEEKNSRTALEHFRLLIQFMDEDLKHLSELRKAIRDGTLQKICFDDLWHLFDYGQEVLIKDKEQPDKTTAHKVLKFTGGRNIRVNTRLDPPLIRPIADALGPGMWDGAFALQAWSLHFDSDLYWPHEEVVGIRRFDGEKEITSLPVYPMKFDPRPDLREELIEQGRVFREFACTKSSHRRYYGRNMDKDARGEHIDSEVIIDFKEATNQNSEWLPENLHAENDQIDHDTRELWEEYPEHTHCKAKGWCIRDIIGPDFALDQDIFEAFIKDNKLLLEPKESVDDSELILLPDWVFGYVLNHKSWAKLSISNECLQEIQATSDPWNDLVLDQETKETVEALVTQHLQAPINGNEIDAPFQLGDFIAGKGRGLVFLLHGPPGVGKTSTAECIAAHMNKPLYPLTSGNLGVKPDDVEDQLQSHFTLAERWGCILLLDEADVFLQRRRLNALDINAIVSVFLRQLEYYKGILFLTTNRVGDMDPAFKSRIHVTLEYAPLDRKRTKKIYKLHLKRIKEALEARKKRFGREFNVREDEILAWAEKHFKESKQKNRQWNGRQIHNAFQTAVALAEWESRSGEKDGDGKPKQLALGKKQFKQVAKVSEGFDQYMTDLMGGKDEAAIAASSGQRLDFKSKIEKASKKKEESEESDSDADTDEEPKKKGKKKAADSDDGDSDEEEQGKKKGKGKEDEKKKGKKGKKDESSDSD